VAVHPLTAEVAVGVLAVIYHFVFSVTRFCFILGGSSSSSSGSGSRFSGSKQLLCFPAFDFVSF
jgi:hypothetical protein